MKKSFLLLETILEQVGPSFGNWMKTRIMIEIVNFFGSPSFKKLKTETERENWMVKKC